MFSYVTQQTAIGKRRHATYQYEHQGKSQARNLTVKFRNRGRLELKQASSPLVQGHSVMKRKVLSARRRLPVHEIAEMSQTDTDSDVTMVAISTSKSRPRQRITKRKSNHVRNIDGEVNLHTDEESVLETGYQLTTSLTQARKAMKSFMDVFMNTITTMQGMLIHLRSA